jgi:hypothetical protein
VHRGGLRLTRGYTVPATTETIRLGADYDHVRLLCRRLGVPRKPAAWAIDEAMLERLRR